jgi:poly-gamma-glutamate capsule biosynthesis protein CapA/YwtB (metallophosphatase superfamily)
MMRANALSDAFWRGAVRSDRTVLYAVGDVAPDRPDPRDCFTLVRDRLREADVAFCQLEVNLTERGSRLPQARHTMRGRPEVAAALRDAGFNVVSFAGNHCMDWGQEGFFDTIDHLRAQQLGVVGVGANITEARQPLLIESKGTQLAFLAYSSILPQSYWAEERRPGCAPLRAHTLYEQIEHDQPGTPARIHTFPHEGDLAGLLDDIRKAKSRAAVVMVSLHWGIHFVEATLADYQRTVAHAAIDAGADLILGHHAHILKAVEIYRGAPILYSLCNFAVDLRMDAAHANSASFKEIQALNASWVPDLDSLYNFPADSRMTVVVKASLEQGRIRDFCLLPAYVNREAQPEIVGAGDPRFEQVRRYLEKITAAVGLDTRYEVRGDELVPVT